MAEKKPFVTKLDTLTRAGAVGLAKAAKQFPQDVAVAMRSAEQTRAALGALDDVAAEPWPPMRVRGTP